MYLSRFELSIAALLYFVASVASADVKPNIVFIVADDLRADVLSAYGGPVKTPNIDKLAERGVLFRRATCGYPICHVSRSEMLSGRCLVTEASPGKVIPFKPEWAIWPEVMKKAGWHTVHAGKWHVEGSPWTRGYVATAGLFSSGGAQGKPLTVPRSATGRPVTGYSGWTFKSNDNKPLIDLGIGLTPDTDAHIADAVIGAIERSKTDRPIFLHVNFTAPHDPLHWPKGLQGHFKAEQIKLPANFRAQHPFDHGNAGGRDETIVTIPRTEEDVRRERAVYYALAANLDVQVGRIVSALEKHSQLERSLIIFTSDQGLALGSHGLMGKQNQYEHTANVPLIVSGPGITKGKRFDSQCALRDLFPTVCELTRLKIPEYVQGKSLVKVLRGDQAEIHDAVFGYFTDTQRMIRTAEGWKLIWYPQAKRFQLFETSKDRDELHDLSTDAAQLERLKRMSQSLKSWMLEQGDMVGKE
jgi:arylsulfatase A-like enzyme